MTAHDQARLGMYEAVLDFLQNNEAITQNLPNYQVLKTSLQDKIASIRLHAQDQERDNSGTTVNKEKLRQDIINRTDNLSGKLIAYATFEEKEELLKFISFTRTDLERSTDHLLPFHVKEVCDNALKHMDALPAYEVEKTEVTDLQKKCDDFQKIVPQPTEKRKDVGTATTALHKEMNSTDELLLDMDKLMLVKRYSEPAFFDRYSKSRGITFPGSRTLAVKAQITDAATGEGVKGVTADYEFSTQKGSKKKTSGGGDLQKGVKKSAAKGGFYIKTLDPGTYIFTFSKEGYATQTVTVYVNAGEMAKVKIALQAL